MDHAVSAIPPRLLRPDGRSTFRPRIAGHFRRCPKPNDDTAFSDCPMADQDLMDKLVSFCKRRSRPSSTRSSDRGTTTMGLLTLLALLLLSLAGYAFGLLLSRAPGRRDVDLAGEHATASRRFLAAAAAVQVRLAMAWFYFLVASPFALVARTIGGPGRAAGYHDGWRRRDAPEGTLEEARRQG